MQRVVLDVDEKYTNLIVDLLSNLKENIVSNITIQPNHTKPIQKKHSQLDRFRTLIAKSDNQVPLTMEIATDTNGMMNDGLF